MRARKSGRAILPLGMLALILLVGCGETPTAAPTMGPSIFTPTPTQEPSSPAASISGRVWHDLCAVSGGEGDARITPSAGCVLAGDESYQANGLLEPGEPGLGGVLIQLGAGACPASGLANTTTDTSGAYAFTGLSTGTYCVSVDALKTENELLLPGNWTFPASDADSSTAAFTVNLLEGEPRSGINFGWDYQFLPSPGPIPSQPEITATPGQPTPDLTCSHKVTFVRDVTIPDYTHLPPGQSFIKTWRLRNDGTCTWNTDYALVFTGGHNMGGPKAIPLGRSVPPGDTVELSVTLTAPAGEGTYEGEWQLRDADGRLFGIGENADSPFWVRIVVGPLNTATLTPTPTPTATPLPTPTSAPAVNNWRGEYYANHELVGNPVLVRDDTEINFNWGAAAPASNLPPDRFSVRWSRLLSLAAGTYRFYALSDDGVRVWLDGEPIIDQWHNASNATHVAERALTTGAHTLHVEYYENAGTAKISFWWERMGDFPQWRGEYFPNTDLSGASTLVRNDRNVDFDWGRSAPTPGFPADEFSARWTRYLSFDEGLYRFHAAIDDGVRLYVDEALVVNDWREGGRREVTGDYRLSAGYHSVRVEYYEYVGDASIQVWWERLNAYPDWRGEYWSNPTLSGNPTLVRNDVTIDFTWGWGAPTGNLPIDNFSARWTRSFPFEGATYRFHIIVDDGARLWVNDRLIIDDWRDGAARELTVDYPLTKGQHDLRLEYYENVTDARIRLWWEKVSPVSYPDWRGEYWSNDSLAGAPTLARNDKEIDFNWGAGVPAPGLTADDFSVRWFRETTFEPGIYLLYAQADDGIRVYLDDKVVLYEWHTSDGEDVYVAEAALSGVHRLVVEYYEQGGEALVKFWWKRIGD